MNACVHCNEQDSILLNDIEVNEEIVTVCHECQCEYVKCEAFTFLDVPCDKWFTKTSIEYEGQKIQDFYGEERFVCNVCSEKIEDANTPDYY